MRLERKFGDTPVFLVMSEGRPVPSVGHGDSWIGASRRRGPWLLLTSEWTLNCLGVRGIPRRVAASNSLAHGGPVVPLPPTRRSGGSDSGALVAFGMTMGLVVAEGIGQTD